LFQVGLNQLTSLPPELGLLTNLKGLYVRQSRQMDLDLTVSRAFRPTTTSSRRSQQKSDSWRISNGSQCEIRIGWIVI
jgi:hypothetical protein